MGSWTKIPVASLKSDPIHQLEEYFSSHFSALLMHLEATIEPWGFFWEKKTTPNPDADFKREESSIVKAAFKSLSLPLTAASSKKSLQFGFQGYDKPKKESRGGGCWAIQHLGLGRRRERGKIYELSQSCWLLLPGSMWDLSAHHNAKWCIISQS